MTAAVFLQAWRKRGQVVFDAESALPWLLGVARQLLRNTVRARLRYQAALARACASWPPPRDRPTRPSRSQLARASVSVPRSASSPHVIGASSQLGPVTVTTS